MTHPSLAFTVFFVSWMSLAQQTQPSSAIRIRESEVAQRSASGNVKQRNAASSSEVIGVCECLRRLKTLNGQMASIRGEFKFTPRHGGWLLDEQAKGRPCDYMPKESRIWWSAIWLDSANNSSHEDGPVSFHEEPPTLDDLIKRQRDVERSKNDQTVVVTLIGQIRTKRNLKIVRAPYGRGYTMGNGYGVGGAYPAVLV